MNFFHFIKYRKTNLIINIKCKNIYTNTYNLNCYFHLFRTICELITIQQNHKISLAFKKQLKIIIILNTYYVLNQDLQCDKNKYFIKKYLLFKTFLRYNP